jgi:glycosyltransferase involved in cell wall biosynthesis
MTAVPPKVTAIVSTCNAERFMRGCLEDLVAQTLLSQMEIIVVDSASPENERKIVEEFQRSHPNIIYLRTEKRETLYAAWNRAILLSRGKYLTNANTDDRHAPDAIEILAGLLDSSEADVAYASVAITEDENARFSDAKVKGQFKARPFDRRRLFRDCMPGPQPVWRRSLHERFGMFDPEFRSAGDYEFWLRISGETKFVHTRKVLGLFLDSAQSISHNLPVHEEETELARARHWPVEWGTRADHAQPFLDKLTRRRTYKNLALRMGSFFGEVLSRKN